MILVICALIIAFLISFFICNKVTPFIAYRMKKRKFVILDRNKLGLPTVAEFGGIGVFLGFAFGIMATIFLARYVGLLEINLEILLAGFSTIAIITFLGIIDDLIGWQEGIRQWQHALLPIIAALPLMAINVNNPPIVLPVIGLLPSEFLIPFIGLVSFGTIYSLIFVPIGVTGASNATNMLAGLNGLEAGLGSMIIATLFFVAILTGRIEAAIIAICVLAALIAFLRFNWCPAKILGGDSLTLLIGAGIAVVTILGNMEKIGILLMTLYFIEFILKARSKFQAESFGTPTKEGTIKSKYKKVFSLTHFFMHRGNYTEKQIAIRLLTIQGIICITVFSITILNMLKIIVI
jgi:UDP-N-acetylglucosamine--dolichyl-phosphate N-acetylglucosaminephosphotransferase